MKIRQPNEQDRAFGKAIAFFRLQSGMTQRELGEKLGVTAQQVSKYEEGLSGMSILKAIRIAELLDVPLPALLEMANLADYVSDVGRDVAGLVLRFRRIKSKAARQRVLKELEKIIASN